MGFVGLLASVRITTDTVATNLILKFKFNMSLDDMQSFEKYYHILVMIVSVLPAIIMLILNNTGSHILGNASLW